MFPLGVSFFAEIPTCLRISIYASQTKSWRYLNPYNQSSCPLGLSPLFVPSSKPKKQPIDLLSFYVSASREGKVQSAGKLRLPTISSLLDLKGVATQLVARLPAISL
ncbi:hypothetical protein Hanom_Chr02g00148931 [Helianthus anomalus]